MDKSIIKKYRAEFENACDDLYYGYGYKFWRTHNNSIEDDNIAKMVWKAAFDKMSQNESKNNTLKLTESEIKNVIMESVKRILNENDFENIKHWYDDSEETYDMIAMIKSDMNPIQHSFKATSLQDALKQAMEYFTGFTRNGEKDVDIFYIKHHGYDGI